MNCYLHPETPASAFCRSCGRPLCALCQRTADATIYCQDHVPATAYTAPQDPNPSAASNPYFQPPPAPAPFRIQTSPGLAFVLGWIPGVGAIYNGQYLKGLVHAVIFGLLVTLISNAGNSGGPLLGMIMTAFLFYMAFEAFHTAKKRNLGVPVEEWSSIMGHPSAASRAPIGPILLIVIGIVFLLDTLQLIPFREIGRFWPVLLIAVGAYMLWNRVSSHPVVPTPQPPYSSAPASDAASTRVMGTRHE